MRPGKGGAFVREDIELLKAVEKVLARLLAEIRGNQIGAGRTVGKGSRWDGAFRPEAPIQDHLAKCRSTSQKNKKLTREKEAIDHVLTSPREFLLARKLCGGVIVLRRKVVSVKLVVYQDEL